MPTKRLWGGAARLYLGLVLAFLYLPIAVMAVMAFNQSALYELPIVFDTVWFESLPQNERLLRASYNSVALAAANMVIATTLGTMAALAFARYRFRGQAVLHLLLFPPITTPWLLIGPSLLFTFCWIGVGRELGTASCREEGGRYGKRSV